MALFFFLGSCKVYRNVENLKPSYSKEKKAGEFVSESLTRLADGDKILVNTKSGEEYFMRYKRVQSQNLIGEVWRLNGHWINPIQTVEISIAEIEEVRVKKLSSAATLAFTFAVLLGFGIYILATFTIGS